MSERKTLAEREAAFTASMGPSEKAKRLAPKLRELAEEIDRRALNESRASTAELWALEAMWAREAAELLRILEQEQWRQREAIKLHLHGRMDRADLRNISDTWNKDPA